MGRRRGSFAKRKRHVQEADTSNVQLSITKKRGRTVVTPEKQVTRSKKDILREIEALKTQKKQLRAAKGRRKRQPAPIDERKSLDYNPVAAGERVDRELRLAKREATKAQREEAKARRARIRQRLKERGAEEIDFSKELVNFCSVDTETNAEPSTGAPLGE